MPLTYVHLSYFTMYVFSFGELKCSFNFQLQPVFVDCIGDLFENQVVLFEAILKSGRYVNQVCSRILLFLFFSRKNNFTHLTESMYFKC